MFNSIIITIYTSNESRARTCICHWLAPTNSRYCLLSSQKTILWSNHSLRDIRSMATTFWDLLANKLSVNPHYSESRIIHTVANSNWWWYFKLHHDVLYWTVHHTINWCCLVRSNFVVKLCTCWGIPDHGHNILRFACQQIDREYISRL